MFIMILLFQFGMMNAKIQNALLSENIVFGDEGVAFVIPPKFAQASRRGPRLLRAGNDPPRA